MTNKLSVTVGNAVDILQGRHLELPSAKRVLFGHRGETAQLSTVTRLEGDVLVIESINQHADEPKPKKKTKKSAANDSVADALEHCDRILTMCDEVPERGESFAADIADKVQGVRDWIEENDHVTEKQLNALEGWELEITRFRDVNLATIHPWALNPLANAIGSVQNAISHLQSVKHHIETPNPPIDAEFQVIKDY